MVFTVLLLVSSMTDQMSNFSIYMRIALCCMPCNTTTTPHCGIATTGTVITTAICICFGLLGPCLMPLPLWSSGMLVVAARKNRNKTTCATWQKGKIKLWLSKHHQKLQPVWCSWQLQQKTKTTMNLFRNMP